MSRLCILLIDKELSAYPSINHWMRLIDMIYILFFVNGTDKRTLWSSLYAIFFISFLLLTDLLLQYAVVALYGKIFQVYATDVAGFTNNEAVSIRKLFARAYGRSHLITYGHAYAIVRVSFTLIEATAAPTLTKGKLTFQLLLHMFTNSAVRST